MNAMPIFWATKLIALQHYVARLTYFRATGPRGYNSIATQW